MAKKTVEFEVKGKDGVQAFWIAVGDQDVRLVNGKGSIQVDDKEPEVLVWWFTGVSGARLSITGTVGTRTVVEVKQSEIPKGKKRGAGFRLFEV